MQIDTVERSEKEGEFEDIDRINTLQALEQHIEYQYGERMIVDQTENQPAKSIKKRPTPTQE